MYWCLFMSKHTGINYAYALSIEESLRLLDVFGIDVFSSCMTHMLKYIRTCLAHSHTFPFKTDQRHHGSTALTGHRLNGGIFCGPEMQWQNPRCLAKQTRSVWTLDPTMLKLFHFSMSVGHPAKKAKEWTAGVSVHLKWAGFSSREQLVTSVCASLVTSCKLLSGWKCCGTRFAHRLLVDFAR